MFINDLKLAFRNLRRNKTYSVVNIAGLSVGLAVCSLILVYTVHQSSYDSYDKNLDRIYLITTNYPTMNVRELVSPFPAGPAFATEFPEIRAFARSDPGV